MAFIARRHRLIVVGSLLLCLVAALALTRLRLDIDVLSMLPQGTPAFDDFRAFVSDFGQLDELIILVEGDAAPDLPPFADAFASRLAALPGVHAVHARIDTAAVLDGILGRYLFNYLSEADYAELATRLTPEGIDRQVAGLRAALSAPFDLSTAQAIAGDPLGLRRMVGARLGEANAQSGPGAQGGYFASADGRALLVFVRPTGSAFDIAFSEQLLRGVRGAEIEARRASGAQGVRVSVTGSYAFALEDAATMKWDIARYTVLALAGVLAVFYFGFRNLRILPFVAYPLAFTTLVTFAISLLLYDELNAVSICFAAILYGLSIDSGIAFYTRLLQERQRPGCEGPEGLPEAVRATLAGLWRANLAVSATTAASFWVIGFSCLGAVRQFGNLTGVGMLITIAQFYTLYPALSFYLSRMGAARAGSLETPRLERLAQVAVTHARPIVAVAVALTIAMVLLIPSLSIDAGLARLRPRESQAARVEEQIEARFGSRGSDGAVLVRGADLERALQESEAVAERLRAYRAEGLLSSVQSVDAVLPSARVQQARLARDAALPWAPAVAELRSALARHGFVPARFEAALSALAQPRRELARLGDAALAPLAVLIDHHVRERHGEYIVATYLQPAPGVSFGAIADRLRREMAPIPIAVAARALLETELASVLRRELGYFFCLSLIGNALLLLLGAGGVATALAILAPVVLAVIAVFAAMAVTGTPIDPINLVVTPMMFGIGVDYGVYIAERARQQGSAPSGLRWEGRAVVVAALTTVVGFGFLGLSRYPPLASMGRLAGAGLFLCLVLSFILLPALLAFVSSAKTSRAMRSANP